jgi:hypothetical protein
MSMLRLCTPWALLAAIAAGGDLARADLAQASPFMPANVADAAAQAGGPIELRGVMSTSEGSEFCIYDTAKKSSAWVALNEAGYGYVVKSADPAGDSVTVQYQGRTMKLVLRAAKVASAGPSMPRGQEATASSVTQTVVLNPTAADEQRRLDAVAAEVRRRRQEREKATQEAQASPNGPGAALPLPGR